MKAQRIIRDLSDAAPAILLLVLLALTLSACEVDYEQAKQKLIDANSNLRSYRMDMKIITNMKTQGDDESLEVNSEIVGSGMIDRQNRRLSLAQTVRTEMLGMRNEMDLETYVMGDFMYMKMMGSWTRITLEKDVWEEQDQVAQIIDLIDSGSVEILEDETIDGKDYYVALVHPDIKELVELALKGQDQESLLGDNVDYADIIKGYNSKLWINKKTWVIERSVTDMKMVLTDENLGLNKNSSSADAPASVEISTSVDVRMKDINKPVSIKLPDEAGSAVDLSTYGTEDAMQAPASITGGFIAEAFS